MARPTPRPLLVLLACTLLGGGFGFVLVPAGAEEESPRQIVPSDLLSFDDGDSVRIRWPEGVEVVRILGIDTPEVQHLDHDLPYAQPFGEKAAGFIQGCLAVAGRIEIVRAADKDPYGRTLAYLYLDGKNYSVLVLRAGLAVANVGHYGDNGLPEPAAEVEAAAEKAGPVPFEKPYVYRSRMRRLTAWMKKNGTYPRVEREEEADEEEEEER